ncbi:MAG: FAD-dependent oxidoreductase [Bacteroidales bacterium]|nr:FAD-dependent oxidoreductase [Bacteroidales bacterium]
MNRKHLAIIGNGMAAGRLLDDLARRGGLTGFHISVFGEEPHGCYNRILLNRLLAGGTVDDITLKPIEWYRDNGVTLHIGCRVTQVTTHSRRIRTADDREHEYDKLIFATGSVPRIPPLDGLHTADGRFKSGVVAYRNVVDAERMREWAQPGRSAIVIGGGLLGLEAAKGLADRGLSVTIVHQADILMNRQLDRFGGEYLRRAVAGLGITVRTGVVPQAILGEHAVEGLRCADGTLLPADLLVCACGIHPRSDLARDSNIPVNKGILVDDSLATAVEHVYAVGECAEHRGQVYGLVQPIYEQCAVLADVLTGTNVQARYTGTRLYTRLKVAGIAVASMGDIEAQQADDEVVQIMEENRGNYRKLIIRNGRLVGAVLVGDTAASAGLIRRLERGDPLPTNSLDLFATPERGVAMVSNDPICKCHNVTEQCIRNAMMAGCRSLQEVSEQTGAGTGCGSCRGQLAALLLKPNLIPASS